MNANISRRDMLLAVAALATVPTVAATRPSWYDVATIEVSNGKVKGPIEDALDRLNGAIDAALAGQLEIAVALAPILLPPGPLGDVAGPRVSNPIAAKIHRAATRVANLTALQQQLLGRIQL